MKLKSGSQNESVDKTTRRRRRKSSTVCQSPAKLHRKRNLVNGVVTAIVWREILLHQRSDLTYSLPQWFSIIAGGFQELNLPKVKRS
ncbi:hypothetical protein M8J75_016038 [Diaphorina citri]|nr:hypothetical protein M8J75_016038 [Diaphorina citri]